MTKRKKTVLVLIIALVAALACELLFFNYYALKSMGSHWQPLPAPEVSANGSNGVSLLFADVNSFVKDAHVNIAIRDGEGKALPTSINVYVSDEGNASFYRSGTLLYTQKHLKASYFRLNAYGKVRSIKAEFNVGTGCSYSIEAAEINGNVPFSFSPLRIFGIFVLICLLYAIRPASSVYTKEFWARFRGSRVICVIAVIAVNISLLGLFASLNTAYVDPIWYHHQQYAKLARALSEGKTYIETPEQASHELKLLSDLEDPYDKSEREAHFAENNAVSLWDIAYYKGHLYVYFGVVPVVLAYLPYYLITGSDLPNIVLIVITLGMVIVGAFLFLRSFLRRYFPDVPFVLYILLSLLLGNCTCAASYSLVPSFYVLPITFSTAFVFFALSLWISAANRWENSRPGITVRLIFGSLFAALVAGCRPQFLVFSALAFPILWSAFKKEKIQSKTLVKVVAFTAPYIIIAAFLMYYNYVRFGSVFDFGANYNLTTNNMPLRGWHWSRLPSGLFDYLLRLPNIDLQFPFVHSASTGSPYMGITIRESMLGGVLVTNTFLWILLLTRRAFGVLRQKRLLVFSAFSLVLSIVVASADTEMAGILWRYTGDFLPLLYFAGIAVFLSVYSSAGASAKRKLTAFVTVSLCVTVALCLLFGITDGRFSERAPESYCLLHDLLC